MISSSLFVGMQELVACGYFMIFIPGGASQIIFLRFCCQKGGWTQAFRVEVQGGAAARGAEQVVRRHEATGACAAAVHGGEAAANETTADTGAVRGLSLKSSVIRAPVRFAVSDACRAAGGHSPVHRKQIIPVHFSRSAMSPTIILPSLITSPESVRI